MKELITIAAAFVIVVGLALFMFVSNDKHSISNRKNIELQTVIEAQKTQIESLSVEIQDLKSHVYQMDSIYHKRNSTNSN